MSKQQQQPKVNDNTPMNSFHLSLRMCCVDLCDVKRSEKRREKESDAFSHGATLGSCEMMAPKYRVLSFGPRIVPGMTSGGGGSCAMLPHRNDVVLSQLIDADDASMPHWMASFACAMSSSPLLPLGLPQSLFFQGCTNVTKSSSSMQTMSSAVWMERRRCV